MLFYATDGGSLCEPEQFVYGFAEIGGNPQGKFRGRDELIVFYGENSLA